MSNNVFPKSIQANPKWTSHESQFCTCSMQCRTQQRIYSPQLALPPLLFTLEDEIEDEDDDDCEDYHDSGAETKDIFHLNIRALNKLSRSFTVSEKALFTIKIY